MDQLVESSDKQAQTMATFVPLGKAKSFDSRGFASSKKFVPLAASGRANTFTGDEDSMTFLRRRLTRFNASFEGEDAAARPRARARKLPPPPRRSARQGRLEVLGPASASTRLTRSGAAPPSTRLARRPPS